MSITPLPELTEYTLLLFDLPDLLRTCQVSHTVETLCQDDVFWKRKVERDFGVSHLKTYGTYKEQYIRLYRLQFVSPLTHLNVSKLDNDSIVVLIRRGATISNSLLSSLIMRDKIEVVRMIHNVTTIVTPDQAIHFNSLEILTWLLDQRIYPTQNGINLAVEHNSIELLDLLDQHGFIPNSEGANMALSSCAVGSLNWLLQHGISPSHISASCPDILDWLVDHNIEITQEIIDDAYSTGEYDTIEWLGRHGYLTSE
jgi:hypothetical protein